MFRRNTSKTMPTVAYDRLYNVLDLAFIQQSLDRRFPVIGQTDLRTADKSLGDLRWLGRTALRRRTDDTDEALIIGRDFVAHLELALRSEHLTVAVSTRADNGFVASLRRELRTRFIPATPTEKIPIFFWGNSKFGANSSRRMMDCPSWPSVLANYPTQARTHLARLADPAFRPPAAGKLILWHGAPGTGKTTALRALARTWEPWCKTEVILDPEEFLDEADYLMGVLLEQEDDEQPSHWRLLVLEDTGEMLNVDAKLREGQRLSRLLNTVDGLIGHGIRLMIMVTTNEPVSTLHPAVARPGRCMASTEFTRFTSDEAESWLRARDADAGLARGGMTLADLYAAVDGRNSHTPKASIGFGAHTGI
jgi:hypothetical protein